MSDEPGWHVIKASNGDRHIVPTGEVHGLGEECWCKPTLERGGVQLEFKLARHWVHHSGDRREYK